MIPKKESITIRMTPMTPPTAHTITFATVIGPIAGKILKKVRINRITTPAAAFIRSLNPFFRMKNKTIHAIIARMIKTTVATISAMFLYIGGWKIKSYRSFYPAPFVLSAGDTGSFG